MSSFLEEIRAALRESTPAPEDIHGALVHVLTAAGEYARATSMPIEEFIAMAVQAWAESHDKTVTQCEVVEEPDPGMAPGIDVLVALGVKWARN